MKILVDTNVILDSLATREPYNKSADDIFDLIAKNNVRGYLNRICKNRISSASLCRMNASAALWLVGCFASCSAMQPGLVGCFASCSAMQPGLQKSVRCNFARSLMDLAKMRPKKGLNLL